MTHSICFKHWHPVKLSNLQCKAKRSDVMWCDAMCSAQIHSKTPVCQRQSTIRSKNVCECANIAENVWPQDKHNQTETNTIRRNAKQFSALFVWFVPNKLRMKNYGNKKIAYFQRFSMFALLKRFLVMKNRIPNHLSVLRIVSKWEG